MLSWLIYNIYFKKNNYYSNLKMYDKAYKIKNIKTNNLKRY